MDNIGESVTYRKTIFIDIDGTILKHHQNLNKMTSDEPELIEGTIEKFLWWRKKEYYIVITTARVEGLRQVTQKQLTDVGLFYDQMIMGLPNGPRVLINDKKPEGTVSAVAYCIERDGGIKDINE
jgi:FMN phosphatase YigB (HAD superfamily)|tara:strand:+ start:640 stop:1014 length:375 start_codon:yes stop_codon:yes gene_type:complete